MNDEALRRMLGGVAAPDELDAQRRAWAVVRGAYAETEIETPRRWLTRPLLAFAAVLAAVGAALSPPGQAVGGWLGDRVAGEDAPRPALASLPAPGRLLVVSEGGAWIVRQDGSKRRLGAWEDATWSPRGLHVAVTRGPRLAALTPEGDIRWTLTRPPRVADPRWSPSGFRIAYRVGRTLRVVSGDGAPDRLLASGVAAAAAAWRPGQEHVLAYADGRGRIYVVNSDTRKTLWRAVARGRITDLTWSADGRRLLAGTNLFSAEGRFIRDVGGEAAFAPQGHLLAVVDSARITFGGKLLLQAPGRLADPTWSPDGRWLLVSAPEADQWLFLRMRGEQRIVTVSHIVREFDPGGAGPREPPRISGWCCPQGSR
jgi:dipeptidyl aminopeptidase/acylaminoacyl peptidase